MPFGGLYGGLTLQTSLEPEFGVFTNDPQLIGQSNSKKSFEHSGAGAAIRCVPVAGAPAAPLDGDFWYDLTLGKFRHQEDGTVKNFGGDENAFKQDGNDFGEDAVLGTIDAFALSFIAGALETMRILPSQQLIVGDTAAFGAEKMRVVGDVRLEGSVTITGDATVTGTTTTINTATLDVADRVIHVNSTDGVVAVPSLITGIAVDRGATAGPVDRDMAALVWYGDSDVVDPSAGTGYWRFVANTGGDDITVGADLDVQARRYRVSASSGMGIRFETDNVASIGQAGNNRPSTIYAGTSVVVGNSVTISTSAITGSAALGLLATGANPITLSTNGSERARVTSSGQLLVGLTTIGATQKLVVQDNSNANISGVIYNTDPGTAAGAGWYLETGGVETELRATGTNFTPVSFYEQRSTHLRHNGNGNGSLILITEGASPITFKTNGTERMRLTSLGVLLIGETSPVTPSSLFEAYSDIDAGRQVRLFNVNAGSSAAAEIITGNAQGSLIMGVFNTANANATYAGSGVLYANNPNNGLLIGTSAATPTRFMTGDAERARILSTGEVIIGSSAALLSEVLSVQRNQNAGTRALISNSDGGLSAFAAVRVIAGDVQRAIEMGVNGSGANFGTDMGENASEAFLFSASSVTGGFSLYAKGATFLRMGTNDLERARFLSTGELLVGATAATVSERFGVHRNTNATTRVAIANTDPGNVSSTSLYLYNGTEGCQLGMTGTGWTPTAGLAAREGFVGVDSTAVGFQIRTNANTYIRFMTNQTERARFLGTGEFLVGATATQQGEFVGFTKNQNAASTVRVFNTNTGATASVRVIVENASSSGGIYLTSTGFTPTLGQLDNDYGVIGSTGLSTLSILSTGAYPIRLVTNAVERVRVTSSGTVGINVQVPGAVLDVTGPSAGNAGILVSGKTTAGSGGYIQFADGNGTVSGGVGHRGPLAGSGSNLAIVSGASKDIEMHAATGVVLVRPVAAAGNCAVVVAGGAANAGGYTVYRDGLATDIGYVGHVGPLTGSGTDLGVMATAGRALRLFSNGNNERARFTSAGELFVGGQTTAAVSERFGFRYDVDGLARFAVLNQGAGALTAQQASILVAASSAAGLFAQLKVFGSSFTTAGQDIQGEVQLQASGPSTGLAIRNLAATPIRFLTSDVERARILSTGEFLIGETATFSSAFVAIGKSQNAATGVYVRNTDAGASAQVAVSVNTGTGKWCTMGRTGANWSPLQGRNADEAFLEASGGALLIQTDSAQPIRISTNQAERIRLTSAGEAFFGGSGYTAAFASERWGFRRDDNSTTRLNIINATSDTAATALLSLFGGGTGVVAYLEAISAGYTTAGERIAGEVQLQAGGAGATGLALRAIASVPIRFLTNDTEKMRLTAAGELLVNTTALVGSEKLRVNGDVYIDGKLYVVGAIDPTSLTFTGANAFIDVTGANPLILKTNGTERARFLSTAELALADGLSISTGTTSGLKIGTAANQKIALYGATPVVQAAASANLTDNSGGTAGDTIPAVPMVYTQADFQTIVASLTAKINVLMDIVRNLGAMAT